MSEAQDQRDELAKQQETLNEIWKAFAAGPGKLALEDLFKYVDDQREMYRKYAEDKAMPHPNPTEGNALVPIDNETVAALLQNSRGMRIVKTYIQSRIDADVAQTNKN